MAPRYIILQLRGERLAREAITVIEQRSGLSFIGASGSLIVFASENLQVLALNDDGFVIGSLFRRRAGSKAVTSLVPEEASKISRGDGRVLTQEYWGSYVAAFRFGRGACIIRDPSGALPVFRAVHAWGTAFASDAALLCGALAVAPEINWAGLSLHLYSAGLPTCGTALGGVTELLPGTMCTEIAGRSETAITWSPWDHVSPRMDTTSPEPAQHLRAQIYEVIGALASSYTNILVGASGGLDSSIVAACLAHGRADMTCLTIATEEPGGDERPFAEILCRSLGIELVEAFYDLDDIEIDDVAAPHLPRPTSRTQSLSYDKIVARSADAQSADAFFTGNGGDNVFAFSYSATSIHDRYLHEGLSFGVFKSVRDICRLTGCSFMQALAGVRRSARRRTRSYNWRCDPLFLHPNVVAELPDVSSAHPWLEAPQTALPGKAVHIAGLLRIQQHLQASEHGMQLPVVNPLMSQPIVELCLSIPSWEWCAAGVDRAVARRAFGQDLPKPILERRFKGTPDGFCNAILDTHRNEIRERLLDGQMAQRGLLDRDAIDHTLKEELGSVHVGTQRLLELVEAESWIARWTGEGATSRRHRSRV